jgi:hypothetical protein
MVPFDFGSGPICSPRDAHHGNNEPPRVVLSSRLVGMIPPRDKQGNAMTDLNKEVRELTINELTIDELDIVTGGGIIKNLIAWYNMEQLIQHIKKDHPMGTTLN